MDQSNSNNRPYLDFGNLDRSYESNSRAYPTTPSTFPQPVFQGNTQGGFAQQMPNGYAGGAGYFNYVNQYQQQGNFQQNLQPQQQNAFATRGAGVNYNDPTASLAQQLSHQNLGTSARQGAFNRQPSPSGRPRTGGNQGQQTYSSTLIPPLPSYGSQTQLDVAPPERNPDKHSTKVRQHGAMTSQYVAAFFKDNVTRARERNERQLELDRLMADHNVSNARKERERNNAVKKEANFLRFLRTKEDARNFTTLKIIGKGAFGEVKLVQKKNDGKIYALKSLVKAEMLKKDQLAHVRSERDVLAESDSPWVVKLFTTFQDSTFLYMLMEFLPGGDLMTMLIKYEIFTEDITRFYMAEIVLAIEAVHKLGFIHRDIKPDNILLDKSGHIKLTDFGLSTGFHKEHDNSYYQQLLSGKSTKARDRNSVSLEQITLTVSNRGQVNTWRKSRRVMAYSTVGTPDYIAPEIFGGHGYSFDCDWWSVGTIMFECLVGWPPFCAEDPHDTYRKIVNWRETLYFPEDIQLSPESENLMRSLICDTTNRLGRGGAGEIKSHVFFHGVSWDDLRKIRAPFEPKLSSNVDTTYFPIDEIDQNDNSAALRAATQQQSDESTAELSLPFVGYTYKRFDAFRGH